MRLRPTVAARAAKNGALRGQTVDRIQALANEAAVCPLGNDQLPGFLPMTSARTISTNGRRRRKYDLIGYATIQVAPTTLGSKVMTAVHERGTRSRNASSAPRTQTQPPTVITASAHPTLSSQPGCGAALIAMYSRASNA